MFHPDTDFHGLKGWWEEKCLIFLCMRACVCCVDFGAKEWVPTTSGWCHPPPFQQCTASWIWYHLVWLSRIASEMVTQQFLIIFLSVSLRFFAGRSCNSTNVSMIKQCLLWVWFIVVCFCMFLHYHDILCLCLIAPTTFSNFSWNCSYYQMVFIVPLFFPLISRSFSVDGMLWIFIHSVFFSFKFFVSFMFWVAPFKRPK